MVGLGKYFDNTTNVKYSAFFKDKITTVEVMRTLEGIVDDLTLFIDDENNDKIKKEVNNSFAIFDGRISFGKNLKVSEFSKIEGPVIIGDNVTIGTNVHIRPYTVIGDNVSIGHGSEIKSSILMNGCKVASNAFVGDSIIGENARVGSGTITANRKFDQTNVIVRNPERTEAVDTCRDFFGVVLGDNSRLGANCTVIPGTHIGHDTFVSAGTTIAGVYPSDKMIKPKTYNDLEITDKEKVKLK